MRLLVFLFAAAMAHAAAAGEAPRQPYSVPRFPADADRAARLRAVLPEIDRVFMDFAAERKTPGLVWGIVLDGELVHRGATGFANLERQIPAGDDTRFRIASMTKSFTALAILKLRDAGRLGLDDRAERHVPELGRTAPLTRDAPPVTIRHLLSMTAGYPQDDPWADRQLADSREEFREFLRGGVSAANPPGVAWEYSNFGYALLGEIVSRVAGEPYQRYITREILEPLGMKDTRWEYADVPADRLALGYRWEHGAWKPEPLLHDGTYGAMGGLITTLPDFARYVAFHLAAWPARDATETGPVRRATLREMHKPADVWTVRTNLKTPAGEADAQAIGYGFGLRWAMDARGAVHVGHSGGLPGFGSNYAFLPAHGVAVISFANLTYAGTYLPNSKVLALLLERAALPARSVPPTDLLERRKRELAELVVSWDAALAEKVVAENFFLDRSREDWAASARETLARAGRLRGTGELVPENQLRGTFPLLGDRGRVDVFFTLTPEREPRVQELQLTFVPATP